MLIFGVVGYVALAGAIAILSSLHISVSQHTFDLTRRADRGDESARLHLQRRASFFSLLDLKNILVLLLAAGFTATGIARFGWVTGIIVSVFILALTQIIARASWISRLAGRSYDKYEPLLIKIAGIVDKYASFVGVVGHNKLDKFQIESKDELLDMARQARGIDSGDKRAIEAQMKMAETKVKNLMVAATEVDYISYDELLGPLVLHDLHKTGHRWFPVVRNDLDSTLGFLDSRDVLTIDSKRSVKAQTAMQHETVRVKPSDNLNVALDTCLKAGSWIALVVDGDEVVGLIGLPAILNHLRGKQA